MAAFHPVEQVRRLAHVRRGQWRWVALQARDDLACPLAHRPPVADHGADVAEGALEIAAQLVELRILRDAVDLVQLPRLGVHRLRAVAADIGEVAAAVAACLQYGVAE